MESKSRFSFSLPKWSKKKDKNVADEHAEKQQKKKPGFFSSMVLRISLVIMIFFSGSLLYHYKNYKNMSFDLIGTIERVLYDARIKMRKKIPVSGKVGLLAIDEASVGKFGRWPFPRAIYKQAFSNLKKAGVKWIGFDVVFSEPERRTIEESGDDLLQIFADNIAEKQPDLKKVQQDLENMVAHSPGDTQLGEGINIFSNVVQGYFYHQNKANVEELQNNWLANFMKLDSSKLDMVQLPEGKKLEDYPDIITYGVVTNVDEVAKGSTYQGFFNNDVDPDGIVRQATLVHSVIPVDEKVQPVGEAILVPGLAMSMAANAMNMTPVIKFDLAGIDSISLMSNDSNDPVNIPLTLAGDGRMLINYTYKAKSFPIVSLADAFDGNFKDKLPDLLVMGGTATGINDIRPSPIDEAADGLEHHVEIIENIITDNFIRRPFNAVYVELSMLIFSGLLLSLVLFKASARTSAFVFLGMLLLVFFVDKYLIFGKGYWYYNGVVYLQIFANYISVTAYKYFTEEKEKRYIKGAFQHYLHPALINDLVEKPDQLKLGGVKGEFTVFFSDVRGFTTISEALTPEALAGLLNEYFTPMTDIILTTGGLLDKYIGDAIMAVWGTPVPLVDHADKALSSSLKMLDVLDELRAKWKVKGLPLLDIGIGINTGSMVAGNIGGDQRFNYTVMGDSVNLGSRLEGVTKEYKVKIILSEFAHDRLVHPEQFLCRTLDFIKVKGKLKPVKIYEGVRFNEQNKSVFAEIVQLFNEGFAYYQKQEWDKAAAFFNQILTLKPDDGPALVFVDRCKYFAHASPGDDWDGVWVMKTK